LCITSCTNTVTVVVYYQLYKYRDSSCVLPVVQIPWQQLCITSCTNTVTVVVYYKLYKYRDSSCVLPT